MSQTPVVSVVVPAFNAARTIAAAVRSVCDQTFADWELIVCDDASTDGTAGIVKSFADPRIRLVANERNAGEGLTRDRAIAEARGRWVAMLDADDAWAPGRLERLLGASTGDERHLVFDDILLCHDTAKGLAPWRRLHGTDAFGTTGIHPKEIQTAHYIRAERLLIKPIVPTQVIREHQVRHTQRTFGADTEYFLRLASVGLRFRYLPEPLYLYRITPGSATATAAHSRMRECLQECAAHMTFTEPERAALGAKIRQLHDYEAIRRLARQLRSMDLLAGVREIARRPGILTHLPKLALRRLAYEAHRLAHGGHRRSP